VFAISLDLDKYLIYDNENFYLRKKIRKYRNKLFDLFKKSEESNTQADLDILDPFYVKTLSDIFESLVGAILMDSLDLDVVWKSIKHLIVPFYEKYANPKTYKEHPKCYFFELIQPQKPPLRNIKYRFSNSILSIYRKREKLSREGIYCYEFRGYLDDVLVTIDQHPFGNKIYEKMFFKKYYQNVKEIIDVYHQSKLNVIRYDKIIREKRWLE
jgi:hypothetical protein